MKTTQMMSDPINRSTVISDSDLNVLNKLVHLTVSQQILDLLAKRATDVITVHPVTSSESSNVPALNVFIRRIISRSGMKAPVILLACIYLERLRKLLPPSARGLPCTRHRVFIASLIVSFKYLNDVSIKNKHWARITNLFSVQEVNLMEKQFLNLIEFKLSFNEYDLISEVRSITGLNIMELENANLHYNTSLNDNNVVLQKPQLMHQPNTIQVSSRSNNRCGRELEAITSNNNKNDILNQPHYVQLNVKPRVQKILNKESADQKRFSIGSSCDSMDVDLESSSATQTNLHSQDSINEDSCKGSSLIGSAKITTPPSLRISSITSMDMDMEIHNRILQNVAILKSSETLQNQLHSQDNQHNLNVICSRKRSVQDTDIE